MQTANSIYNRRYQLFLYIAFFCLAGIAAPLFGSESLDWSELFNSNSNGKSNIDRDIFFFQRIPRSLLGLLAGGTLAVVGAVFQVILRNPLAEPYTLGVTGGASVGAVAALTIPGLWFEFGPFSTVQLFSIFGAFATLWLIYQISKRPEGMIMSTLLLAGITISVISVGCILFLRYISRPDYLVQIDRWMMGGLEVSGYSEVASIFPLLLPGLWILYSCRMELNHLTLGEELASGHGVDVQTVQQLCFFGGAVATAVIVSVTGPISFIGLIVPHAVRRISGFDHRLVLPASFCMGAGVLVICDTVARILLAPREMPVGIITALIGGPLFIWILVRSRS